MKNLTMCSFRVKSVSETALWISEASLFKKNTHIGHLYIMNFEHAL